MSAPYTRRRIDRPDGIRILAPNDPSEEYEDYAETVAGRLDAWSGHAVFQVILERTGPGLWDLLRVKGGSWGYLPGVGAGYGRIPMGYMQDIFGEWGNPLFDISDWHG